MPRKPRPTALSLTPIETLGTDAWSAPDSIDAFEWGARGVLYARLWCIGEPAEYIKWSKDGAPSNASPRPALKPQERHQTEPTASPDGARVATIDHHTEHVLIHEGELLVGQLPSQGRVRRFMAWSPDGAQLAIATTAGYVELWDIAAATLRWQRFICARAWTLIWSPDGASLLCGAERRVRWLDPVDGSTRPPHAHTAPVSTLRLDADGLLISCANTSIGSDVDGDSLRWTSGVDAPERHDAVDAVPTALGLITALDVVTLHPPDAPPRVLHDPALPPERFFRTGITTLIASPNGQLIYAAQWAMRSCKLVRVDPEGVLPAATVYQHKERHVRLLALSHSDATLAIGVAGRDVVLLDTATDTIDSVLTGLARFCAALAWSPDDTLLAGADVGKTLAVWSPADSTKPLWRVSSLHASALAFSADGARLYVADRSTLRVYSAAQGVELANAQLPFNISSLLLAPDGSLYVGGDDLRIHRFALI
jgi:WD40 repeat protein